VEGEHERRENISRGRVRVEGEHEMRENISGNSDKVSYANKTNLAKEVPSCVM
jgi:hypothetical protein